MISGLYGVLYKIKHRSLYLAVYRCIKILLNIFYPVYCRVNTNYNNNVEYENVIVSLTSFPARINTVWLVIETLLRQKKPPEKIILWLAKAQFESHDSLPKRLLNQRKAGLEIRFCEDLKAHKKYFHTMLEYPNAVVITVDDDTFYPEDLVENLMKKHNEYPGSVCCNIGHIIGIENGDIAPYKKWVTAQEGSDKPSYRLLPVGCGGVLYPPGCLNQNVFDKEQIDRLCPLADDMWLKAMASLNRVKAVKCKAGFVNYANLIIPGNKSLYSINADQNMNDIQLANIIREYPELMKVWIG